MTVVSCWAVASGWYLLAYATNQQEPLCDDPAVLVCDNFLARGLGTAGLGASIFLTLLRVLRGVLP